MSDRDQNPFAKGQLKREAADWFIRMRDVDAESHRAEFEQWLARGAMHRAAYNSVAHTYLSSGNVNWAQLPRPRPVRGSMIRTRFAIAAAAMLLAFFAWRFFVPFVVPPGYLPELAPHGEILATTSTQFVTRLGEIRRIDLADGSHVTLDTDTLVSLDFRADERELRLEHGRARFEVAHDPRPFVVNAGDSEVIARGTIFDVSQFDRGEIDVRLLRGRIEVRRRKHGPSHDPVPVAMLQPGQGVHLVPGALPTDRPVPRADPAPNWPSGSIDFPHATLRDVVDAANRYSVRKIRLATPDLERIPVSGMFHVTDADRLAASLSSLFGLSVTHSPDEIILDRPKKYFPPLWSNRAPGVSSLM